ncbi:hypothetical protein SESBI_35177 [Sesbania bispinosa]|nr:hypothetical protein SESBI_35177 [Sesbania bispinosa]
MRVFVVPWNSAISPWIEDIERFEHSGCSPKKTVQVSVPLIADNSETENVQVNATVKDVGLDEMQVGSSQGLGAVGPDEIHVGGSGGLGGVGHETMHVGGSEGQRDVVPETMHVGGSDGQRDVGPDNVAAGGSEGVRDVGPKIVAAGGSDGVRDARPKIVVAGGSEGVRDVGPKIVRDVGPKIVADAGSEGVRDVVAQNVEYDEDSEEERALGADDDFMHPESKKNEVKQVVEVGEVVVRIECRMMVAMWKVLPPPDMENMYIMEEDYETEELHSGTESSDGEGGTKPRYPRFHKEDMCKQFKWKVGMEFASLQEFKDAMLEHNILNGKEVKFVKNDLDKDIGWQA